MTQHARYMPLCSAQKNCKVFATVTFRSRFFSTITTRGIKKVTGLCTPSHLSSLSGVSVRLPRGVLIFAEANPILLVQPIPPCWGQAVPAWGTHPPFLDVRCVVGNKEPALSIDALIVSSSRYLRSWRASQCPRFSTNTRVG